MTTRPSPAGDPATVPVSAEAEMTARLVKVRHDLRNPLGHIMGFSELLIDAARKRKASAVIPPLEQVLQASDELVLSVNQSLDPASSEDRGAALEILEQQLRAYAGLVLATVDHCHPQATALGEPFLTDFNRITGAAEKLLSLVPALHTLHTLPLVATALPLPRTSEDNGPSGVLQVPPAFRTWKDGAILIIDPDNASREGLRQMLTGHGYNVIGTANTRDALAQLQNQAIDLVLLDLALSNTSARTFLQSLRSNSAFQHLPVLTLCSTSTIDEASALLSLGADDFVPKPVRGEILMARTRCALDRKRGHDQERAYLLRLQGEQERCERLLHNLVPAAIGHRLKQGEKVIVDEFEQAAVVWARVSDFNRLAERLAAEQLVSTLNGLFTRFDLLADAYGMERSRTQIDSYLAVAGVSQRRPDHAQAAAHLALGMQREIALLRSQNIDLSMRIVLSSGALSGGLIGARHFTYDVWGPTLDQAQELLGLVEGLPENLIVTDRATSEALRSEFKLQPKVLDESEPGRSATVYLLSRADP